MAAKKDPRLTDPLDGRGPGAYLRKVRLEAGISVDKVASALLLNPDRVEALEADAYEHLPAPTFVRGYLRGYARVLGLASGPVLEMYDRQGFDPPPLTTDVSEAAQAHTSDTVVRIVTYAVAAVLALLVGLWWHSQEDGGFGIGSDLFDWSTDAVQDLSLLAGEESGTAPVDGETGGESIAMVSPDPTDELPLNDEPPVLPFAEDAATSDIAATETAPDGIERDGETSPATPLQANESSGGDDAPVTSPAGNVATGDLAAVEAASDGVEADGESGPAVPLQSGTSSADNSAPVTPPADEAVTDTAATAESVPGGGTEADGESRTTAPLQPDTSSGDNDAPAADAAATGDIAVPDGTEADNETIALAPLQSNAPSGDDDAAVTSPVGEVATGDIAVVAPVPTESSAPEATADGGDPASQESQPEVVAETETGADSVAGAEPEAVAEAIAEAEAGAEPGTVQSGLVLEFVHESWVEVYDHERTRLFFDLVQPGRTLSINGTPPFDILLGYGKDVRVAIDGQAFDHTPYLTHGVARFSIGAGPDDGADATESAGTTAPDAANTQTSAPESQVRGR